MKQKLFLSDVDGTLLKTGHDPHPEVVRAVKAFVENGGKFALSTGRAVSAVEKLTALLPINAPCLLCAGAIVYDFEKRCVVSVQALDETVFGLLQHIYDTYPDVSITVYTAETLYNIRKNDRLNTRGVYEDRSAPMTALEDVCGPLVKVLLTHDDPAVLDGIGEKCIDKEKFDYFAASTHFYELTARGVCKGTAAETLVGQFGGSENCRLFAAGDAHSDLTMQPLCELFFSPETAPESVRARADVIFPNPKDGGLAAALDRVREAE